MSFELSPLLVMIFLGTMIFGMAIGMFDLIGVSLYDLRAIKRQKEWRKHPFSRRFRRRPLISIIVPAHNEERVIERCLNSLVKSSYRKYEVIVVNDASTDGTKKLVKGFIAAHPKKKIRLMSKRKNIGKAAALNSAYKRFAKGEIIMILDADSTLEKDTLRRAINHFITDDSIKALAPNVRAMPHPSIIGLLQQFEYLSSFRSKKFYTLSNAEYIVGGSGALYQREVFRKLKGFKENMWTEDIEFSLAIAGLGNKQYRLFYASDVIVYTEPALSYGALLRQRYRWKLGGLQALFQHKELFFARSKSYTRLLAWFRLPLAVWGELMLLVEPFMLTYFIYLAVTIRYPLLFAISWVTMTMLLTFVVWTDEYLPLRQKARLSFFVPMMFTVFYVMTFIQVVAMIRCVFNIRKITGKVSNHATWRSPERLTV